VSRKSRKLVGVICVLVALLAVSVMMTGCKKKEEWPSQNITCIVPVKPGGGLDLQARLVTPYLEKELPGDATVIIKNVSGAGQVEGVMELFKAAPDGYTIGCLGVETTAFMWVMNDIDTDPRELNWLGQMSLDQLVMAVNSQGKFPSLKDMAGQEVRWGVTAQMLPSAAVISKSLGSIFRPVMFDNITDCSLALMRGDVDAVIASWPRMMGQVRDSEGKLTAVCTLTRERIPDIKEVPTIAETGVEVDDAVYAVSVMRAFVAPPNLPDDIKKALTEAVQASLGQPKLAEDAVAAGYPVTIDDAQAVIDYIDLAIRAYEGVKDVLEEATK
jgi:tripartite-type tricarboxylate transporter receptor subunit TctC